MIRHIEPEDTTSYLNLLEHLDAEQDWMTVQAGERVIDPHQMRRKLTKIERSLNSTIFIAETDACLTGYLACYGGGHERNRHRAAIAVAIRADYRRRGIASQLFDALWQWAPAAGLRRIEVDVIEANTPAVNLYRAQGFVAEGVRWDSICIDGIYYHEIRMARILKEKEGEATIWHEKANAAAA